MEALPPSATLSDVARLANVSSATASRALTGRGSVAAATRDRVRAAAAELGYASDINAASLVTGRSHAIGVVSPSLGRWYFGEVIEGVQSALQEAHYDLVLYHVQRGTVSRADVFEYFLARRRFDGIIVAGIDPDMAEAERLAGLRLPTVSIGGYDLGTSLVAIDDHAAARVATEHLIQLGHTDIAFVGGDPDGKQASFGDARRVDGYREAMRQAGLEHLARHAATEVSMPGGYRAGTEVLGDRRTRPSAIVGVCDEVAVGVLTAARRLGIAVPNELSVVGIDDHELADMHGLTTVRQHPRAHGTVAVELLLAQLDDPGAPAVHRIEPTTLALRASSSARS